MVQKPGGQWIYYQVVYQVNDKPATLDRELALFRNIKDK